MQQILSTLKQAICRSAITLGLAIFIFTAGFFIVEQPSLADTDSPLATEQSFSKITKNPATRESAYEEAVKAAKNPKGLEKEYEKEMKVFKEDHPDENPLVEGVKEAVEKVTGKE